MLLLCIIDAKRKRSSDMIHEEVNPVHEVITIQLDDGVVPKPFNVDEYLSHFKNHHKTRFSRDATSNNTDSRYVLFILDGSGSIGIENFKKMKKFVADLASVFQFCGFTAVMVYDDCAYLEYGYECYEKKYSNEELDDLHKKIIGIPYPNGLTASDYAIKMAYLEELYKIAPKAKEIDIIFMTDGRSNVGENPCKEANSYW